MELLLDGQLVDAHECGTDGPRRTRNRRTRGERGIAAPEAVSEQNDMSKSSSDAATAAVGSALKEQVRENYARAARRGTSKESGGCCGTAAPCGNPITSNLYADSETGALPTEAVAASLGCGNPTALAELKAGETVLDLGSGGGIDVLLSARRVGPSGKAYGLDMTDEMLALAEENKRKSGLANVEFLKGEIENIPLPDSSVDVIISNCVITLAGDKDRVMREAFRVLKPGGRFAVSDVVVRGEVPAEIKKNMELWVGCVAGALSEYEYVAKLSKAGFDNIDIEPTRVYSIEDARAFLSGQVSTSMRWPERWKTSLSAPLFERASPQRP